jgi:hypothetical protein
MDDRENRAHPRHELKFKIEYSVLSRLGTIKLIEARTLDFSLSGARIETEEKLKSKDQLSVRIELPDLNVYELDQEGNKNYGKTVLMCFSRVRWVEEMESGRYNAGIWFSGIGIEERVYLKLLLDEYYLEVEK